MKNSSRSPLRCWVAMYRRLKRLQSLLDALTYYFDLIFGLGFWRLNSGKGFFLMLLSINTILSSIAIFAKFLYWFSPTLSIDFNAFTTYLFWCTISIPNVHKFFHVPLKRISNTSIASASFSTCICNIFFFHGVLTTCQHWGHFQRGTELETLLTNERTNKQTKTLGQRPSIFEIPLGFRLSPLLHQNLWQWCYIGWGLLVDIQENAFSVFATIQ